MSLRVLARWFLDAGFQVTFLKQLRFTKRMLSSLVPETMIRQAWCPHFGTLGAILRPWEAKGAAQGTPSGLESDDGKNSLK